MKCFKQCNFYFSGLLMGLIWPVCLHGQEEPDAIGKPENQVVVVPTEYQAAFRNPMKGLREFFSPGVDKKRAE